MARKLDAVKTKAREGAESFKKGAEQGKKAVSDAKQMKKLIDSLPTDVDDEVLAATKAVEQGTKSDAEGFMKSEVSQNVESGRKTMESSSKTASEQVAHNEKIQAVFAKMDSVGSFGKNARSDGGTKVEATSKEFNKAILENEKSTQAADEEFKKNLSEISSTF